MSSKDNLTVNEVAGFASDSYPTEAYQAYILNQLHQMQTGQTAVDPERIRRLRRFGDLIYVTTTDDWANPISDHALTNAMSACLGDLVFWERYPRLSSLLSNTIARVSNFEPNMAYNTELQSKLLRDELIKAKIISQDDIKQQRLRVIGNQKPITSAISDDLNDRSFLSDLSEKLGLKPQIGLDGQPDLLDVLDSLETVLAPGGSPEKLVIAEKLLLSRFQGYDQRRGRIQVADPQTFDRVVKKIHEQVITYRLAEWFVDGTRRLIGRPRSVKYFNLRDYFRLSRYDGVTSDRKQVVYSVYAGDIPSEIVLDHYSQTDDREIRYAAYHARKPNHRTPRHLNFELQVTLGTDGIQKMNQAAQVVLTNAGNFQRPGLTDDFIRILVTQTLQEASSLMKENK